MSVSNHCYANTSCQGEVVGVAREWRSSEGCVAVVNGWEHTPNTPWWLIAVSLFGYRAHRRSALPSDGHVEAHVGTADGFMQGLNRFNKRDNFRSTSVSMAGSSRSRKCYVQVFFFLFFFLTSPNQLKDQDAAPLPGLLTTPSTFYCYTQWLDVRVCLSLCWKAAPRFHSDMKRSDQADSKYSWWQTGVAKWNLVGRRHMDINVCTNVWGTLGSTNSTTKCNSIS